MGGPFCSSPEDTSHKPPVFHAAPQTQSLRWHTSARGSLCGPHNEARWSSAPTDRTIKILSPEPAVKGMKDFLQKSFEHLISIEVRTRGSAHLSRPYLAIFMTSTLSILTLHRQELYICVFFKAMLYRRKIRLQV